MTEPALLEPSFADVATAIESCDRSAGPDPVALALLAAPDRQGDGQADGDHPGALDGGALCHWSPAPCPRRGERQDAREPQVERPRGAAAGSPMRRTCRAAACRSPPNGSACVSKLSDRRSPLGAVVPDALLLRPADCPGGRRRGGPRRLHALPRRDHGAGQRRRRPARHRPGLEWLCRYHRGLARAPARRAGGQGHGGAGLGRLPGRAEDRRRGLSQRAHAHQAQRQRQAYPAVQAFDHSHAAGPNSWRPPGWRCEKVFPSRASPRSRHCSIPMSQNGSSTPIGRPMARSPASTPSTLAGSSCRSPAQTGCLDEAALERLDDMRASLEFYRRDGLTEKNLAVIRQVLSGDVWSEVVNLPAALMAQARLLREQAPVKAAVTAQIAVAIGILTFAPVRLGNLVADQARPKPDQARRAQRALHAGVSRIMT